MIANLEDDLVKSIIDKYGRNLQKINLSNNGLKSISRINEFANSVESLNISKNEIVDLTPIESLQELRELNASDNFMYVL
jgi:Leucine-rich repeat (LRR) protein